MRDLVPWLLVLASMTTWAKWWHKALKEPRSDG